jgi:hypothetical protein
LKELLKLKTREYIYNAEVVDHIFAQVKGGLDVKPLIGGAVFKSSIRCTHDIHLIRFAYRLSYLKQFVNSNAGIKPRCQVCDLPFNNRDDCINHVMKVHRELLETYHPIFIGNLQSSKKFDIKTNRINTNIMKAEVFASIVLPFEHLDFFFQIGDNVTEQTPLFIVCIGRMAGSEDRQVFIQKVELTGNSDITVSTIESHKDPINFLGISNLSVKTLTSLTYDPTSKLLLITQGPSDFTLLKLEPTLTDIVAYTPDSLTSIPTSISPSELILGLKQGHLYVQDKLNLSLRKILVDTRLLNVKKANHQMKETLSAKKMREEEKEISERDILMMQVDEEKVNVNDIRRYEKLMNGKSVLAFSNANIMQGEEKLGLSNNKRMYTKHHWIIDQDNVASKLELEFDNPTSLIALNVELTFNCRDSSLLLDSLKHQQHHLTMSK